MAETCAKQDSIFTLWPVAKLLRISENSVEFVVSPLLRTCQPPSQHLIGQRLDGL